MTSMCSKIKERVTAICLTPIHILRTSWEKTLFRQLRLPRTYVSVSGAIFLDKFNGDTPSNYYSRFKWVIKAATTDKYFITNPTGEVAAQSNPSKKLEENLEVDDYISLLTTPCRNQQVKLAFLFSCYTGLRWVDVKAMEWKDISKSKLTTRLIQKKTGRPVILTLHPIAQSILEQVRSLSQSIGKVFDLPTANGANKILKQWVKDAGIEKYITWSCARLSFSILLKDHKDDPTIAYLLGHTTTKQVQMTYKRHRPKDEEDAINCLPSYKIKELI